jgi:hypothetical protein
MLKRHQKAGRLDDAASINVWRSPDARRRRQTCEPSSGICPTSSKPGLRALGILGGSQYLASNADRQRPKDQLAAITTRGDSS